MESLRNQSKINGILKNPMQNKLDPSEYYRKSVNRTKSEAVTSIYPLLPVNPERYLQFDRPVTKKPSYPAGSILDTNFLHLGI